MESSVAVFWDVKNPQGDVIERVDIKGILDLVEQNKINRRTSVRVEGGQWVRLGNSPLAELPEVAKKLSPEKHAMQNGAAIGYIIGFILASFIAVPCFLVFGNDLNWIHALGIGLLQLVLLSVGWKRWFLIIYIAGMILLLPPWSSVVSTGDSIAIPFATLLMPLPVAGIGAFIGRISGTKRKIKRVR